MQEELKCAKCGFGNDPNHRFCRQCGAEIEPGFDEVDQVFDFEAAPKTFSCGARIFQTIVVLFILFIIFVIIINTGMGRRSNDIARQRHCFANMRVLYGAIEMYNMDHDTFINKIDSTTITTLVEGRYLRSPVECPGSRSSKPGAYYSDGDLAHDGQIFCTVHGSIDSPAPIGR